MAVKTQSEKRKLARVRSWSANQAAKLVRKDAQASREAHNREVGSTGKQRDNELRKALGSKYRIGKRAQQSAGNNR